MPRCRPDGIEGNPEATVAYSRRDYGLWLGASTADMLARSCQEVALPFVVFSLTASTASTGVVQTAGMIAFLRFALFGGVLVDRVDRRAAMIARGLSGAVPLTVGPSSRRARSGRPTGWAWRPPSRRWPR
ncbi:MAG: MFS transporter [Peptidiphaga sp.]